MNDFAALKTIFYLNAQLYLITYHFFGSQSIRTQVNSYSSQFVLVLVNSYSKVWSIRTHLVNSYSFGQFVLMSGQFVLMSGQFVLILVDSYSFWSIRTHTQMGTNRPK